MPGSLSTSNAAEAIKSIVREHFLVKLSFATPVYLSSRGDLTFDSQAYEGVNMELDFALDGMSGGTLSFLDEDFAYVGNFISEGSAGIACQIWMLYGDPPWTASDDDELFNGEFGAWGERDDKLSVRLELPEEKWLPDFYINVETGFNHLPKPGTRFKTANGIIELGKV